MIAQTCSVYFTIVAAVDCFVQVCMPIKIKRLFSSPLFTKCVTSGILAFAFIYNIPHCFESVLLDCWHPNFQSQSVEVCPAPLRFHPTYMLIYYKYMYAIFLAVGPLLVLIALNIIVIIATVFCKKGNSADNLALILVVLLFILCNTVALLINIFETHLAASMSWRINYIIDISNLLVVFNSSFNFVIYYNFSRPFRCTFSRHFGPTTSPQKSHSSLCGHSPIMRHHTVEYTNKSKISNGYVLQKCTRSQSLSAVQSTTPFIMGIISNENCNRREINKTKNEINENIFNNLEEDLKENPKVGNICVLNGHRLKEETILEERENSVETKIKNPGKINNDCINQQKNPLIASNTEESKRICISNNRQRFLFNSFLFLCF
ncbi:hypothetical protein ACQ4LE_005731 [Meloidogyne hapla]